MTVRRILSRAAVVVGVAVAALAGVALLVHLPAARRVVLRYAATTIEQRYGIRVEADRLDYNLATWRVGLVGVRVSAVGVTGDPFVAADYVSASLSLGTLTGDLSLAQVGGDWVRVTIRRRSDGTTNLPASSSVPSLEEPVPLPIARLEVPRLSIDLRDDQAGRSLSLPSLSVLLAPEAGHIRLDQSGELRDGERSASVTRIEGDATFDGRTLRVAGLQVDTEDMGVRLDGTLTVIARTPAMALKFSGSGDAAGLARWARTDGELPRAMLAFEGDVEGPFSDPSARLSANTDTLQWESLTATAVRGQFNVTSSSLQVAQLGFDFNGGAVQAFGLVPFAPDEQLQVAASWKDVDAASTMTAFVPEASVAASGSVTGALEARGVGADIAQWSGTAHLEFAPGPARRGALPLAGPVDLSVNGRSWQVNASPTVARVMPIVLAATGMTSERVEDARFTGTLRIGHTDVTGLVHALRTSGLADIAPGVVNGGAVEGTFTLGGLLTNPDLEGGLTLQNVRGSGVEVGSADIRLAGRPFLPELQFELGAPNARVAEQALSDVRATGRLRSATVRAPNARRSTQEVWLDVDELRAGEPTGAGMLGGRGSFEFGSGRYSGSLTGSSWPLTAMAEQPVSGRLALDLTGEGTLGDLRAAGKVSIEDARMDDVGFGRVDADVELQGRTATVRASASDFSATADARIQIDAPYVATIDARTVQVDLARLFRDVELSTLPTGTATATLRAEGPLETWRSGTAMLEVSALDATVRGLILRLDEPARLAYNREQVIVERLEAGVGAIKLSASGSMAAFDGGADSAGIIVTAAGNLDDVAKAAATAGFDDLPVTGGSGPAALLARVFGNLNAPIVSADLDVGPGTVDLANLPSLSDVRFRAHAAEGWVELQAGSASYQDARLDVTGKAPLDWFTGAAGAGGASVRALVSNVTPAVLAPFVPAETLQQLEGSVDATLEASSPSLDVADVTGEIRFDRFDVRIAGLPVSQQTPTRLTARDGILRVESWDWTGQGATLAVRGLVRLRDREMAITTDGTVDLRVLTPFVRSAGLSTAGRLVPRLSITGALEKPAVAGEIAIADGEMRLIDPRVLVSDLSVQALLGGTSAHVVSLTGSVNGGRLVGGGGIEYTPEGLVAQLSVDVQEMALEAPQGFRSALDASLALNSRMPFESDVRQSGRLSGTVTVRRGAYREPMAVLTGFLAGLSGSGPATDAAPTSPFMDTLALDIHLLTDDDIVVDNNYARMLLGADVRVVGTAAAPAMGGRADLREGGQLFVGRNTYTVVRGAVDFISPVAIEPSLNIEAVTSAGGEDITVTITGPAESPTVALRSTSKPELGEAELTSLLLTGRSLEDLDPGDAAFIGSQVVGNLSGEVLGFASRAVGLDTIRLGGTEATTVRRDSVEAATDVDPTTRLTFGKSLRPDLEVTFSQSLRDADAQTAVVQYDPVRNLELRLVSNDDDLRSYGFRHDLSFGTGRPQSTGTETRPAPPELRVVRVDVSGELGVEETRVRDVLRTRVGDRFDFSEWQTDRDRVEALYRSAGYFTARVAARRSEAAGGVALAFQITAGPRTRVEMTGFALGGALRSRIEMLWTGSVFDDFLLEEVRQAVLDALSRQGHLRPMVNVQLRSDDAERVLVIAVDPGPRSTRTVVEVGGVSEALQEAIRTRLASRDLVTTATTNPTAVVDDVLGYLRGLGYLQARVASGEAKFDGGVALLPVTVTLGPEFTVGQVLVDGARTLPETDVRAAIALVSGMPYNPTAVEAARASLAMLYRREAFVSATASVRTDVRTANATVDVFFLVTEGPRQVVAEVVVAGNRETDTDVIVRTLGLSAGDPLTADAMTGARTRVFDTGLFRRLDVTGEALEDAGSGPTVPLRVRVNVEEWPALRLRYGFVVAEERPETNPEGRELVPGLSADITRRTLFGRAITLGSALDLQRLEQGGRMFVSAPTLLGLPISSSIVLERSRREFQADTVVTELSKITWEQRIRLVRQLRLSYAYTYERNHTFDTEPDDPDFVFDLTINLARFNTAAAWDTRDDYADTTRGLLLSSSFDFVPETLGSDIRFVKELVQGYYYRPLRNMVLASAARFGVVVPLGGQDVIPSERFFAGGSRTVRGIAEDTLGPRNVLDDPAGGRSMLLLNQEARIPVYRWVRAVGFLDVGNVFSRVQETSLRDTVGAIGVGLRIATPVALLRVDFGKTVWGTTTSSSGRWTFGLGHAF